MLFPSLCCSCCIRNESYCILVRFVHAMCCLFLFLFLFFVVGLWTVRSRLPFALPYCSSTKCADRIVVLFGLNHVDWTAILTSDMRALLLEPSQRMKLHPRLSLSLSLSLSPLFFTTSACTLSVLKQLLRPFSLLHYFATLFVSCSKRIVFLFLFLLFCWFGTNAACCVLLACLLRGSFGMLIVRILLCLYSFSLSFCPLLFVFSSSYSSVSSLLLY